MTGLTDAAVELGRAGYRVFPVALIEGRKQPLVRWSREATSDPERIAALFRRHGRHDDLLIGLCTGDGLVVVDDDRGLAEPDEDLSQTRLARTRSRGHHHYYVAPAGEHIPNSAGKILPGIDIRGDGGFVVAPPSPGWSWVNDAPIAPLPEPVLAAIRAHAAPTRGGYGPRFEPREPGDPLVPAGARHDYLLRCAGWMVAGGLVETYGDLVAELLEHAEQVCEPPARHEERVRNVKGIARWVIDTDRRRP
jgi:hypothetical protein